MHFAHCNYEASPAPKGRSYRKFCERVTKPKSFSKLMKLVRNQFESVFKIEKQVSDHKVGDVRTEKIHVFEYTIQRYVEIHTIFTGKFFMSDIC